MIFKYMYVESERVGQQLGPAATSKGQIASASDAAKILQSLPFFVFVGDFLFSSQDIMCQCV